MNADSLSINVLSRSNNKPRTSSPKVLLRFRKISVATIISYNVALSRSNHSSKIAASNKCPYKREPVLMTATITEPTLSPSLFHRQLMDDMKPTTLSQWCRRNIHAMGR